ncbi:MAG: response regulator [Candidatus Muiribacteriota bacterium]
MKIYILDDKDYYVNILSERLRKSGFIVIGNTDAFEALHELSDIKDIDMLLLDYNMPLINGLDFINKLNQKKTLENVKIIVMANEIPDEDMVEVRKFADSIIFKPFILQDLMENIEFLSGKFSDLKKNKPVSSEIATFKKIIEDMRKKINNLEDELHNKNKRLEEKDIKINQFEENQKLFVEKLKTMEGIDDIREKLMFELEERNGIIDQLEGKLSHTETLVTKLKQDLKEISAKSENVDLYKQKSENISQLNYQNKFLINQKESLEAEKYELELKNDYYRAYIYFTKNKLKKAEEILNDILEREPNYIKAKKLLKKIK